MKSRRGFRVDYHGFCKLGLEIIMESKRVCREREFALGFKMEIQDFGWLIGWICGIMAGGELGEGFQYGIRRGGRSTIIESPHLSFKRRI